MGHDLTVLCADMRKGVELIPWKRIETIWKKIKAPLSTGQRVWWYYKEDTAFARKEGFNPRDHAGYSGIVIPQVGSERRSLTGEMEPEDVVIVHDWYPVEKCYPDVQYVTLIRLLLSPGLVEIFSKHTDFIGIKSH